MASPSSLFEDSWKRIGRSRIHAEALWGEVDRLFPKDGYTVLPHKESERTWTLSAAFKTPVGDNTIALELGEFFYQLRAALDAAVWKAVWIMDGTEPPANASNLEFPIYTDEGKFNNAGIHKLNFPQELRDWLATIQPYSADKSISDPDSGLNVTLKGIHDCARKDRHRRLHVFACIGEPVGFECLPASPGVGITFVQPVRSDFLKGENTFLRFGVAGSGPDFKINLATSLKVDIAIEDIPIWGPSFGDELKRFGLATEYVINRFDSVFAKLGY